MRHTTNPQVMKHRTKALALQIIRLCRTLPRTDEYRIICRQLLRCSTSVAANYRAACRARSTADFISKIGIVLEEADETHSGIELLHDAGVATTEKLNPVLNEADELVSIFVASLCTARANRSVI